MKAIEIGILSLVLAGGCFSTVQVKAPEGEKLAVSAGNFPHETFNGVLAKHVDDKGKVDYKALKADRGDLERYLVAISESSPDNKPELFPTKDHELAYWINAYNAYVLYAVTERPQMKSVEDDLKNFFYFTEYVLGGKKISLYNIENEIVRKRYKEPRIHFALNCASWSCPELPPEAFMPDKLEEQLAREAKEFCAHPEKVFLGPGVIKTPRITSAPDNAPDNLVRLSQIFEWYADDFVADGGPVAFCKKWGRDDLPAGGPTEFIQYDWTLNAQPGRALFE